MGQIKKYYIVYKINEKNNDLEYIKEYQNKEELRKDYNLQERTDLSKYIAKSTEEIKEKIQNSYIIFKETENG